MRTVANKKSLRLIIVVIVIRRTLLHLPSSLLFVTKVSLMSSGRASEEYGLRFGVEIELVLRSKHQKHTTFISLASEICQHLKEAKVSSHLGNLDQKTGAAETYQEWTIIQDSTLPSNMAENKCKLTTALFTAST
jgi:hypothetical protein